VGKIRFGPARVPSRESPEADRDLPPFRLGPPCAPTSPPIHATSDGAFTEAEPFASALEAADEVLEPKAPFHIHFSDIAYANRNETKHLPYGEGTLRADPLKQALRKFRRTATVISESPDLESDQAIRAALSPRQRSSR
jgi:endonuclease IV